MLNRVHLISREYSPVMAESYANIAACGVEISIAEEIHAVDTALRIKTPRIEQIPPSVRAKQQAAERKMIQKHSGSQPDR